MPPCLVQNEQVQARTGISAGSGSQVKEKEMFPQWHLPWINMRAIYVAAAPTHTRDTNAGFRSPRVLPSASRVLLLPLTTVELHDAEFLHGARVETPSIDTETIRMRAGYVEGLDTTD